MDVIVLGIMLVDATLAVHDFAHALHLDIKPDNVLLMKHATRKAKTEAALADEATRMSEMSALLTDFGLMHKLSSRVQVLYCKLLCVIDMLSSLFE